IHPHAGAEGRTMAACHRAWLGGVPMPYLAPHFHYDMFMSYAHGHVPGVDDPPLRRWSQAMIDGLKADIGSLFTEFDQLTIWDDRSLDPTAALTDELREKIERSCLLLIVMSPRYLGSGWCTDELTWFAREFAERRKGPVASSSCGRSRPMPTTGRVALRTSA